MEILDGAQDDRLRAFGLGYLAHLAADSVAHNYFVPKQLAVTSSTSTLGHSYWESRFETHLGTECARQRARADPHRSLAVRRAARPRAQSHDLQHADQPPDLPRNGDRRRQRIVAADLPADDREQPLGSRRRRRRPLPRAVVRLHHRPAACAWTARSRFGSIRRATRRCGWRSRCDASRCARAAKSC